MTTPENNPTEAEAYLSGLREGLKPREAAAMVGLSLQVVTRWAHVSPDFAARVEVARSIGIAKYGAKVRSAADEGDWKAALAYLERLAPDDYGARAEVRVVHETAQQQQELVREMLEAMRRVHPEAAVWAARYLAARIAGDAAPSAADYAEAIDAMPLADAPALPPY